MISFAELKVKAGAELLALKAGIESVEERIEAAFNLGATQHMLHTIENDMTSVEQKVLAAFKLGKSHVSEAQLPVVPTV